MPLSTIESNKPNTKKITARRAAMRESAVRPFLRPRRHYLSMLSAFLRIDRRDTTLGPRVTRPPLPSLLRTSRRRSWCFFVPLTSFFVSLRLFVPQHVLPLPLPCINHRRGRQNVVDGSRQPPTTTAAASTRGSLPMWRGGQGRGQGQRRGWLRSSGSPLDISPRRDDESLEGQLETAPASEGAGAAAGAAAAVLLEVERGTKPTATGIGWVTILSVFVTQVLFVGLLFWVATPAIRESNAPQRARPVSYTHLTLPTICSV